MERTNNMSSTDKVRIAYNGYDSRASNGVVVNFSSKCTEDDDPYHYGRSIRRE